MLRFIVLIVVVFAAVAGGAYFALPHAFPTYFAPHSQLDATQQLELLELLAAGGAGIITSIVAAGTSVVNVRYQLNANKELEDHKGKIIGELDHKKNDLAGELETHKNNLAGQLDKQRQELGFDLALKRLQIETTLAQLASLTNAVGAYRYGVGALRRGEFDEEDASARAKDLDLAMNSLDAGGPLYQALDAFRQRGLYLVERASRIETSTGQRNLWREPSKAVADIGEPLGPLFAADGEKVRALLSAERTRLTASR